MHKSVPFLFTCLLGLTLAGCASLTGTEEAPAKSETVAAGDKIVGPGNVYVAAAKRQVFGTVGIDMIAGPSEIMVLADGLNDPDWIAADLLSQAEHDTAAQAILITDDGDFADRVLGAIDGHLKTLPRAETAAASWRDHGAVIVVDALPDALPLIDRLAPEHLEIAAEDADALAEALDAVLADPDLAERLGGVGRRRAADMTWEAAAEATAAVYREVLGR